jgi:ferredoxin
MMTSNRKTFFIYYFSGTGNAFSVAKWIEKVATEHHHEVRLINIAQINRRKLPSPPEGATIGFISPTHGFNFPPIMFHFIMRFPRSNHNRVFIANTRGGLKVGKYFLPGLSGMAQYFSAAILRLKGYQIIGMRPVDLPSNWISLHPGLKGHVVESIFARRQKETEQFALKMVMGKSDLKAMRDIIQDLAITPVGILYYFFGRYLLAKSFMATDKCDGCNLCIDQCPVQAITLVDHRPFWTYKCESCMQCMNQCPKRAVETAHGYIFGLLGLVHGVILFRLYRLVELPGWYYNSLAGNLLSFVFDSIVLLGCLFVSYRGLHYLKRFTLIEKLLAYTSLTRYSFWRRYKLRRMKFWKAYHFKT